MSAAAHSSISASDSASADLTAAEEGGLFSCECVVGDGDPRLAVAASLEPAEAVGAGLVPLTLGGVSTAWLLGRAIDQPGRLLWLQLEAGLMPVAGERSAPLDTRLLPLTLSLALPSVAIGEEAGLPTITLLLPTCAGAPGDTGTIGEPRAALHSSIRPAYLSS